MFQKLITYSIHNKLVVGVLTLALIAWGVWSLVHLPFDATPDITNNQVQVITQAPSLGAQEVEQYITTPVEMALANIPRLEERRSISRSGLSVITLVFDDAADIYWARSQVSQVLEMVGKELPKNADIEMGPIATGLGEIFHYTVRAKEGYEDKYSLTQLRTIQDWIVRKQLSGTPGIAEVSGWGGYVKQYEVAVDNDRLNACGVSVGDIYNALEKNNANTGGSYIEENSNQYYIRGIGTVGSIDDIANICVKSSGASIVRIADVAQVREGHATRFGAVTRNGEGEVVAGIAIMLKGENFQEVIKNVKERIALIQKSLPEGVVIEPFIDRTNLVSRVEGTIARNLIEGGLIVIFVLVLFLGNWRAGLVVASVIPLSMLFAFGMMKAFGIDGNLMSLGAIDFGMIVDSAVIIVEAVVAHIHGRPASSPQRLTQKQMDEEVHFSASRIRKSAAFGEIIIMIVYVPLMTLVGIEGKMFRPMALTVFFAILGAFILSLTYVPMASSVFLSRNVDHKRSVSDKIVDWLKAHYRTMLEYVLARSKNVITAAVALFCASVVAFKFLGGEFIPSLEEGDFAVEMSMAQGTSLTQMVETCSKAEHLLKKKYPEIKQIVSRIGSAEIPTDPMPVERADIMVALKPKDEWTSARTADELREKMEHTLADIPGLEAEISQPIQMRNNELLTGIKQDVAIKIFGDDMATLSREADKVARIISGVRGVSGMQVEKVTGLPQIQVKYDRVRMAQYGLSVADVNDVVETTFAGAIAGAVYEGDKKFDIVVRLADNVRNAETLRQLAVPLPSGDVVPLEKIADIVYEPAPAQVSHEDGARRIYVGFNVKGRDVQTTVNEIQNRLSEELKLPEGYYYTYGGEFKNLQSAVNRLMVVVPVALIVILLLLYATLKNVRESLFVFSAIPLAAIGGVWALWFRGMPFSISAGVGFIALFGVAVLNGIVLMGQINQDMKEKFLTEQGVDAIVVGSCLVRLRPVLMTALVASMGFLPMALSHGDGAEVQRPLATVVIGGLITSTLLTLFVLPSIYKLFGAKTAGYRSASSSKRVVGMVVVLCGMWMSGSAAYAQKMSLNQCLSLAAEHNLLLKKADKRVEQTRAMQGTAWDVDRTELSLSQDPTSGGSPDNALSVSQTIMFPTYYAARHSQLKAETKAEECRRNVAAQQVRVDIVSAYWQLVYDAERVNILLAQDSLLQRYALIADQRYKAGESRQLEVLSAKRLLQENKLSLAAAQSDVKVGQRKLAMLIGTATDVVVPADSVLVPLSYQPSQYSFAATADGALANSEVTVAEKAVRVAKNEFVPSLSVALKNQLVITGWNPYHENRSRYAGGNFMGFEVGIGVPLFFGAAKAKLKAARKEREHAELNMQELQQVRQTDYDVAMARYQTALAQMNYYVGQGSGEADNFARLASVEYENGEITYTEYSDALQEAIEIRMKRTASINDYNMAVVEMMRLTGEDIKAIDQ